MEESEELPRACPRRLTPPEVLDMHADLHKITVEPQMRPLFRQYAETEAGDYPQWAASHLNPGSLADLDPWLDSLGSDLELADTYQVAAEMLDLAEALRESTADLEMIMEEDLPSESGFMWFDRPVERPAVDDNGRPPLLMHAVSWNKVDRVACRLQVEGKWVTAFVPGVRIREWGWNDDMDVIPRPLHLIGQSTCLLNGVRTPLPELWLVHMLWLLMGMEITARATRIAPRATLRRAAGLNSRAVHVILLRRPTKIRDDDHRPVDWTCTWLVRGHWRNAPHHGTFSDGREKTWVRPHLKGPDGFPLRITDILIKLAR